MKYYFFLLFFNYIIIGKEEIIMGTTIFWSCSLRRFFSPLPCTVIRTGCTSDSVTWYCNNTACKQVFLKVPPTPDESCPPRLVLDCTSPASSPLSATSPALSVRPHRANIATALSTRCSRPPSLSARRSPPHRANIATALLARCSRPSTSSPFFRRHARVHRACDHGVQSRCHPHRQEGGHLPLRAASPAGPRKVR